MCFPRSSSKKPVPKAKQKTEKQVAVEQRIEADEQKREEVEKVAEKKREDISEAIETKTEKRNVRGSSGRMRGGRGRRSLFRAGGAGFLGRFG